MKFIYAGLLGGWMCVACTTTNAQEPEPSAQLTDKNLLVLSDTICGSNYGGTPEISDCHVKQQQKADRWLDAIIASYTRLNASMTQELKEEGRQNPPNAQIWLERSQYDFERLRLSTGELVQNTGYPGSGNPLFAQQAMFRLTIERARLLLRACASTKGRELKDTVDLTVVNWCG